MCLQEAGVRDAKQPAVELRARDHEQQRVQRDLHRATRDGRAAAISTTVSQDRTRAELLAASRFFVFF